MNPILEVSGLSKSRLLRLAYFAIGFSPITTLALAIFKVLPLHIGVYIFVLPSIVIAIALGIRFRIYGILSLKGLCLGILAVFIYDLTRLPFVIFGGWRDFIPEIGGLLLNGHVRNYFLGYLWRYLGNGGGMGLAFFMAYPLISSKIDCLKASIIYGVLIWLCLLGTLIFSPNGQEMLFHLNYQTFCLSLVGHLVYGGVIGTMMKRYPLAWDEQLTWQSSRSGVHKVFSGV